MDILERLNMPPCDKTRVPVKALEEQLEADSKQKKMLTKHLKYLRKTAKMHILSDILQKAKKAW